MTSGRFVGKNVMVTAAGAGFGRAAARAFAAEGASAVCLVERLADRLDAVAAEVQAAGARPVTIEADLGDAASTEQALTVALESVDRLDVLISNHAAMTWEKPYLELADEDWDLELRVNLTSHHVLAQRAARAMVDSGGGVIVFTASVNALGAGSGAAPYCVTKAGLVALCQVMAVELARDGVRVNCVSPGPADTQRSIDLVGEEMMEQFRASFPGVPMNRLASAEDVAEAFLYLASDAAGYVTGHNLIVDGGLTAQIYDVPD
jgi:NAD(P)-dependent dehydrogenase (short-subunit alcohol dehydrogenase family)